MMGVFTKPITDFFLLLNNLELRLGNNLVIENDFLSYFIHSEDCSVLKH
jgi:hypothetical protein